MLPSLQLLKKVSREIMSLPNRRKESKRRVHYGLFLLGYKSGLRISEAIKFDLKAKTKKGLYRISKPKGKSERLIYISEEVIRELKANNWQPNQTNHFAFYHFLKKVKRELNIGANIELSPHTLRRAFATYHAEKGMPLPLLQKLLGHSSIRTTALYWRNIYGEDDPTDILAGKKWLENRKPPEPPTTEAPIKVNLEKVSKLPADNLLLFNPSPKYLSKISQLEQQSIQIRREKDRKLVELEQQNNLLRQDLSEAKQFINQLKQNLTKEKENSLATENNLFTERKNNQSLKEIIANLTHKIQADEQNHTNLLNAYQKAFNDKVRVEKEVNYYESQLKSIAKSLYQWSKIRYYQQLEQEQKFQIEPPLPFKK